MPKQNSYIYGRGRRKTASARIRIFFEKQDFSFLVNDKPAKEYFDTETELKTIQAPLALAGKTDLSVSVRVTGGGKNAQAGAIRLGVARALISKDEKLKTIFKKAGFLTRDSREKERKKFGLKRARRAPQWSKR